MSAAIIHVDPAFLVMLIAQLAAIVIVVIGKQKP